MQIIKLFIFSFLNKIYPRQRVIFLIFFDIMSINCAFFSAYGLFFSFFDSLNFFLSITPYIFLACLFRIGLNFYFGLYKYMWRYASTKEFTSIIKSILTGSIFLSLLSLFTPVFSFGFNILFFRPVSKFR